VGAVPILNLPGISSGATPEGKKINFSNDVTPQNSVLPRGCLEADFYCFGLGLGLEG